MATKKKAPKKQTIVGKLQTFDANRKIKVTRSMARLAGPKSTHSNAAKLSIARKGARGLMEATIKKNKAKNK